MPADPTVESNRKSQNFEPIAGLRKSNSKEMHRDNKRTKKNADGSSQPSRRGLQTTCTSQRGCKKLKIKKPTLYASARRTYPRDEALALLYRTDITKNMCHARAAAQILHDAPRLQT